MASKYDKLEGQILAVAKTFVINFLDFLELTITRELLQNYMQKNHEILLKISKKIPYYEVLIDYDD